MKKILTMLVMLAMTLGANAQFEYKKTYLSAGVNNLDMSYNGSKKFSFGIDVMGGQFVDDNILLYVKGGYNHQGRANVNDFNAGVGVRYYIIQNGIFLGASGSYAHGSGGYNDIKPAVELGYCFFLTRELTIEPAIYYEQSFKKHSDFSTIGLKLNFGLYLPNGKVKKSISDALQ